MGLSSPNTLGERPMPTIRPNLQSGRRPGTSASSRPRVEELEARCLLSTIDQLFVGSAWQDLVGQPIAARELAQLSGHLNHGVSRHGIVQEIEQTDAYHRHLVRG